MRPVDTAHLLRSMCECCWCCKQSLLQGGLGAFSTHTTHLNRVVGGHSDILSTVHEQVPTGHPPARVLCPGSVAALLQCIGGHRAHNLSRGRRRQRDHERHRRQPHVPRNQRRPPLHRHDGATSQVQRDVAQRDAQLADLAAHCCNLYTGVVPDRIPTTAAAAAEGATATV